MTLNIVYGLDAIPKDDPYINVFQKSVDSLQLLTPGAVLESFPFLARLPSSLPGMAFLKEIVEVRKLTRDVRDIPWKGAIDQLVSSNCPCHCEPGSDMMSSSCLLFRRMQAKELVAS